MSKFTVTEDHIKLLNRMYIDFSHDAYEGAPAVNIKRPYGNSDVVGDIAEILGWELVTDRYGDATVSEEQGERALKLHEEMATVLQILAQNPLNFQLGTYVNASRYGNDWELTDEVEELPATIPFKYYLHGDSFYEMFPHTFENTPLEDVTEEEQAEWCEKIGRPFYEVTLECELDTATGEVTLLRASL